jgi:hypothetical protein
LPTGKFGGLFAGVRLDVKTLQLGARDGFRIDLSESAHFAQRKRDVFQRGEMRKEIENA